VDKLTCRRALEALRAGVPNRDVVRLLAPLQPEIETRFRALLDDTTNGWAEQQQAPGLLLGGGFGSGKSHQLEYFRHLALESNFVCSSIVLSKETPLYDLNKVYRSCVESAVAPGKNGPAMVEITSTYDTNRAPHYVDLFQWVHKEPDLDPRFAATLLLFERQGGQDEDLRERIIEEWTGYPMKVSDLRAALRAVGEGATYKVGTPMRGQIIRRFEFLSRFFRSAGYSGWVVLLDETEMVSRYSLRQRGLAYAHLAQLGGQARGTTIPGLACVFTITDDYAGQVIYGKDDIKKVPARLGGEFGNDALAAQAQTGMRMIERAIDLKAPSADYIFVTYQQVHDLYRTAYDWSPPDLSDRKEYALTTRMRQYVRSWINSWDLRRLYDYDANTVTDSVAISYDEDADLQVESSEDDEGIINRL